MADLFYFDLINQFIMAFCNLMYKNVYMFFFYKFTKTSVHGPEGRGIYIYFSVIY